MIEKFKLRHLNDIAKKDIDYNRLLAELVGYRDNWLKRRYYLIKYRKKIQALISIVSTLKMSEIKYDPQCEIKMPEHVDFITFSAMMKVQMLLSNPGDKTIPEIMCELIALVCFSANFKQDFDTDSLQFRSFKNRIWNSPFLDMVGLYNHISKELDESSKKWKELFASVQVSDKDYELAGGHRMEQFNVISTIENLCNAFNYTEEEAWQVSYILSQTLSYKNATSGHIQYTMAKIKEREMKQKQRG